MLTTSSAIVNESSHIVDVCRWADRCGVGFLSPSLQRLHFACVALRGPHQHGLWALLGRTLRSACVFSMCVYVFHPATSGCFMWYSWTEQRLAVSLCTFSSLWVRSAGVLEGVCLLQTHTYTHKKIVKKTNLPVAAPYRLQCCSHPTNNKALNYSTKGLSTWEHACVH